MCELLCSLSNQNACFITFFCIQLPLFCTVLRKNCTVLNQSESSNFFMYIISELIAPQRANQIARITSGFKMDLINTVIQDCMTWYWLDGRHVVRRRSSSSSPYEPVIHAASHFDHKKRVSWVPIFMYTCDSFFFNYGAPLSAPSGCRRSAKNIGNAKCKRILRN